jgi:hypothetical protein
MDYLNDHLLNKPSTIVFLHDFETQIFELHTGILIYDVILYVRLLYKKLLNIFKKIYKIMYDNGK